MKKKSSHDRIIETAIRLFYKQGYSNTGINQIIEEAGIAKSTLYEHFPSKEDLLVAYLEITGVETVKVLKETADKKANARDKILAIFDYLEELVGMDDFYGCHFLNMVYELPAEAVRIKGLVKKQKDAVRMLFENILSEKGQGHLADEVYTVFEGALIANKVHNNSWPVQRAREIVSKIIWIFFVNKRQSGLFF